MHPFHQLLTHASCFFLHTLLQLLASPYFVIGIIAYCNVGALQGVNTVTSCTLISIGSAALAIELLIAFLFFTKKDSPINYADYARLKNYIRENEYVFYYDHYNPNLVLCAHFYNEPIPKVTVR